MIAIFGALALIAQAAEPVAPASGPDWTWSLYEDAGPVVLANEVPDTARLRATLECEPGSGVAQVSVYGQPVTPGFATVRAGAASTTTEAGAGRAGQLEAAVRVDHPVFAAFAEGGNLTLTVGGQRRAVSVQAPHLAKLRRFAELCAG